MQIETGLFAHGVLQRTARNVCDVTLTGGCRTEGRVHARVLKGKKPLRGWGELKIGVAAGQRFSARLRGVPAGGPYTVELWIADGGGSAAKAERLRIEDVCVGDVWILAGQSNMQGIGWLEYALQPDPQVRAFYADDRWAMAQDPLHRLWAAVDPVHATVRPNPPQKNKYQGVGPGLSFAQALRQRLQVPQGLLPCAHGGTSMAQWDPAKRDEGGQSLYGATIRRLRKNGGRCAGVLWYQGESDAGPTTVGLYTDRMCTLIASFRRDAGDPRLPFVLVQLARHIVNGNAAHWNSIQEQQRRLPRQVKHCLTVPAIDLDLDDGIHVGGRGQAVLGRRLAEAMTAIQRSRLSSGAGNAARGTLPPIELKSVTVTTNKVLNTAELRVKFSNLAGPLKAAGEPHGFSLSGGGGVIRTLLNKDTARVLTGIPITQATQFGLHYGQGYQPVCNIYDGAGRPLPVFGPVALGRPRAATEYIHALQVSPLLASAGDLTGLKYPPLQALELKPRAFDGAFCDIHLDSGANDPAGRLVYFRFGFHCAEAMALKLWLGYDGPVKVWIDGDEKFHDPQGANPARIDDAAIGFQVGAGRHEALVALGTNRGNAWGVYLQLERSDVTQAEIEAGLAPSRLPQVE